MKPFIVQFLKCTACNSEDIPDLKVESISLSNDDLKFTSLEDFLDKSDFLLNLVAQVNRSPDKIMDIEKSDVDEFIEKKYNDKIMNLMHRTDIMEGSVICTHCRDQKFIRNGILHMVE